MSIFKDSFKLVRGGFQGNNKKNKKFGKFSLLKPKEMMKITQEESYREEIKEKMQKEKQKKQRLGCLVLILILALIIIAIIIISGGKSEQSEPQNTQEEILIEVSLDQLKAEYDANQLAADTKYKGKLLKFSATIRNISKDITGRPLASLTTREIQKSSDIFSAACYFKRGEEAKLIGLKNEQIITVIGRNDGMTIGVLSFKDCDIQ